MCLVCFSDYLCNISVCYTLHVSVNVFRLLMRAFVFDFMNILMRAYALLTFSKTKIASPAVQKNETNKQKISQIKEKLNVRFDIY